MACIGLGAMGGPLAHRLLVEGATRGTVRRMVLWDRVTEAGTQRAAEWSSKGAAAGVEVTSVASLEELGRAQPQWVVTCLPTSADVASVATALAPHLAPSTTTVWIDCTSGDPQATRALANRLAQREPGHGQVVLVDAALSGGPRGAAAGTLTVMVGGTKDNVALVTPVISTFAREIVHAGGVGAGHAIKAANNQLTATGIWSTGEMLVTLSKLGVDPAVALAAINKSSGRSWASMQRFPDNILTRGFDYGFRLSLLQKDIRTACKMAAGVGAWTPLALRVKEMYEAAGNALPADADHVEAVKLTEQLSHATLLPASPGASEDDAPRCPDLRALGIELVVFDCAGTVIDEGALVYEILQGTMKSNDLTVTSEEFDKWHGTNKRDVIAHFVNRQHAQADPAAREAMIQRMFDQFMAGIEQAYFADDQDNVRVFPGVLDVLRKLRAAGIKVGLNTGYPRVVAERLLTKLNLWPEVDELVVADDVGFGRPYPYMIHHLMRRFALLDARRVAKVGDTARDMLEGKNAGCGLVIGVLSGADGVDTLLASGADVILPGVANMVVG